VERLVIMADLEQVNHRDIMENFPAQKNSQSKMVVPENIEALKTAKKQFLEENFSKIEKQFLKNALEAADGNITKAAKKVNMQRSNFSTLMKKHNIKAS
jgi:DNA-binding NtrC family response regulator